MSKLGHIQIPHNVKHYVHIVASQLHTALARFSPHGLWYYFDIVKDFCLHFFYLAEKICRGCRLFLSTVLLDLSSFTHRLLGAAG